jgi:hypothetical protein
VFQNVPKVNAIYGVVVKWIRLIGLQQNIWGVFIILPYIGIGPTIYVMGSTTDV